MEHPSVSVIVLNFNGKDLLDDCLSSLSDLDYPADKFEVLLVDNASADGSADYVAKTYPTVGLIRNEVNSGFAGGNNLGARQATGEFLAFLNNDARVDPQWLTELVAVCIEEDVACAASKMLSWDGAVADFVSSAMNFHGFAFQPGHGLPDTAHQRTPLLFACGGAMLVRRSVFLDVGGFDEDYFLYFEDMDLGWRLWLLGHDILFAPKAIAYHRIHGSTDVLASFRKWVVFERNALITMLKNYSDENLHQILAASLLVMFRRAGRLLQEHGWDVAPFSIRNFAPAEHHETVNRTGLAVLVAANEAIDRLPQIFAKRKIIQSRRVRSDAEVFQRFGLPLFVHPILNQDAEAHYNIGHYFRINQLFRETPRRILVLGASAVGITPETDAGASVVPLLQKLSAAGHDLFVGIRGKEEQPPARQEPGVGQITYFPWKGKRPLELINHLNPEVVIALDASTMDALNQCPVPLIFLPSGNGTAPDVFAEERVRGADLLVAGTRAQAQLVQNQLGDEVKTDSAHPDDSTLPAQRRLLLASQLDEIEAFCRMPRKVPRAGEQDHQPERVSAANPTLAPTPPKSFAQLISEALYHFRRGGVRIFLFEFLGYLQKQVGRSR